MALCAAVALLVLSLGTGAVQGGGAAPAPAAPAGAPGTGGQAPAGITLDMVRDQLRRGDYEAALALAQAVVDRQPADLRARFYLGLTLHKTKRYALAQPLLEAAAAGARDAFPEAVHASHYLGWCRYYLGDLPGARAAFEAHVAAVPDYDDSHFGLGVIAFDEDRLDDARASFERALAILDAHRGPARERAKNLARLGDVALRQERLADAESAYRRAVDLWPDHYEAWAKLARVLDRLDRPQEAQQARARREAILARAPKEATR
ncbi:MAG: tetratricopeptide repeat protein [Phycisphaerales bacterium]